MRNARCFFQVILQSPDDSSCGPVEIHEMGRRVQDSDCKEVSPDDDTVMERRCTDEDNCRSTGGSIASRSTPLKMEIF